MKTATDTKREEIVRLVDAFQAAVVRYTLVAEESRGLEVNATADAILSAIDGVIAERDAWKRAATYWYLLRPGRRGTDDNVLKIPGEAFDVALQSAALGEQPNGPKP